MPLERRALQTPQLLSDRMLASPSCAYRLDSVTDLRADGSAAGSLGPHAFTIDDAAGLVRQRLVLGGLFEEEAPVAVWVQVRQLYIAANQSTKIPVAVYRVGTDGGATLVLRSRAASVNWHATEAESRQAIVRALDDVDRQLAQWLESRCASRPGGDARH